MLDITLLGTGGMKPLPHRHLTSMMARYNGSHILIDCGEGTQVAIRKCGLLFKPIDVILFTHYHGDHIGGLPGLLLTMGNSDRTEPVVIVGPKGTQKVAEALRIIAQDIPFALHYIELEDDFTELWFGEYRVEAFKLHHRIPCYGYSILIDRAGKFDVDRAKELGLPVQLWSKLQKGDEVEHEGTLYTPDMVLGPARKGLKVTYCTDSRPVPRIADAAKDADLFICEGMYGDKDKQADAEKKKHMTFYEAAALGAAAQPKEMWLTHFSPSLIHPAEYMDDVHKIFDRVYYGKDGKSKELHFAQD